MREVMMTASLGHPTLIPPIAGGTLPRPSRRDTNQALIARSMPGVIRSRGCKDDFDRVGVTKTMIGGAAAFRASHKLAFIQHSRDRSGALESVEELGIGFCSVERGKSAQRAPSSPNPRVSDSPHAERLERFAATAEVREFSNPTVKTMFGRNRRATR